MRKALHALLLVTAAPLALAGCGTVSPQRAAKVAGGFASQQLCTALFVSGLDGRDVLDEEVKPTYGPAAGLVHTEVDREHREVRATFAGLVTSRAAYRGQEGCLVLEGAPPAPPVAIAPHPETSKLAPIAPPDVVAPVNANLSAAIDHAFEEPAAAPHRWTKAVVVLRHDKVVGERYAPGYGPATPLSGWSMSKSVTNALIGVLVRQGKLKAEGPAPLALWPNISDPHWPISIDSLLRMTSGLAFGQSLNADASSAFDPTSQMVFGTRDMAAYAASAPVGHAPGTSWTYSNGNTLLLSRIIRDQAGGDARGVTAFAYRELFDKLGMEHMTFTLDATGTPVGASLFVATPRDWARLGLLYLHDGVIGGERILPEGWADYSARPTPAAEDFGYGAGFWTNRGSGPAAKARQAGGMPADSFFARGSYGQVVIVVPSEDLVIVRMGYAYTDRGDIAALERLTREAIAALR